MRLLASISIDGSPDPLGSAAGFGIVAVVGAIILLGVLKLIFRR
jgi:hypothetical protein